MIFQWEQERDTPVQVNSCIQSDHVTSRCTRSRDVALSSKPDNRLSSSASSVRFAVVTMLSVSTPSCCITATTPFSPSLSPITPGPVACPPSVASSAAIGLSASSTINSDGRLTTQPSGCSSDTLLRLSLLWGEMRSDGCWTDDCGVSL